MQVYKIDHYDQGVVNHASRGDGYDVTLCGLALEGEEGDWSPAEDIKGKINCEDCFKMIKYCKSISKNDLDARLDKS